MNRKRWEYCQSAFFSIFSFNLAHRASSHAEYLFSLVFQKKTKKLSGTSPLTKKKPQLHILIAPLIYQISNRPMNPRIIAVNQKDTSNKELIRKVVLPPDKNPRTPNVQAYRLNCAVKVLIIDRVGRTTNVIGNKVKGGLSLSGFLSIVNGGLVVVIVVVKIYYHLVSISSACGL